MTLQKQPQGSQHLRDVLLQGRNRAHDCVLLSADPEYDAVMADIHSWWRNEKFVPASELCSLPV